VTITTAGISRAAGENFKVHIEPGGHELRVRAGENILAAALAAGVPLPHSCRAGRCASCKAKLLAGEIAYPADMLPPGIVASEAARGEVLLCQATPRTDLRIVTRAANMQSAAWGVVVEGVAPLTTGGQRVTLRFLGAAVPGLRPGKYIDVETAGGERERVPIVAVAERSADIEVLELTAQSLVRAHGPFDAPR
jgi:CDP-4-dehydro-6-deoxyglucose reductase, E3